MQDFFSIYLCLLKSKNFLFSRSDKEAYGLHPAPIKRYFYIVINTI